MGQSTAKLRVSMIQSHFRTPSWTYYDLGAKSSIYGLSEEIPYSNLNTNPQECQDLSNVGISHVPFPLYASNHILIPAVSS